MTDEKLLIDEFRKNSNEVIRVSLSWFKGKRYLDARVFLKDEIPREGETGEGQFNGQATKKGLTLHIDLLPELIEALQRASQALRDEQKTDQTDGEIPF